MSTPPLHLDDLTALDAPPEAVSGRPLLLSVDAIDEDPQQPRREFETNALHELAETIRERGVRQPVSVRPNLHHADRWILNFGARRLRAAKLAGLSKIPAFIDATADNYDQVIENEQREGLKPLELALFVEKRLASGDRKSTIARKLGKSRQYVTLATALIEAPNWLLAAYREGRCRGMAELYDLRRLHREHSQVIETWVSQRESITREDIGTLRSELAEGEPRSAPPDEAPSAETKNLTDARDSGTPAPVTQRETWARLRQSRRTLHVELEGQDYQLVVNAAPAADGHFYVRPLSGGPRRIASAGSLKLRGFVDK